MTESFPTDYKGWLAKLISFKTVSKYSNLPLIDFVKKYLESQGIQCTLVHDDEKTKANLLATLPGENGATKGGLLLSGHTDVVPTEGQKWDTDPFTMVEKEGKLYGRGSSDMLGFIAVVLQLTPYFLKMKRTKPIHYAFSYDEEVGCHGAARLTEYLRGNDFEADACIVGEATSMTLWTGNKGLTGWNVQVHGKPIHSSAALMDTSCNAIEYAAQIIREIRRIAVNIRDNGKKHKDFFPCPFACMTTGIIHGGNAVNTVPEHCEFFFNIRTVEDSDQQDVIDQLNKYINEKVLPEMRKEFADASVTIRRDRHMPAFVGKEDEFTKSVRSLLKDDRIKMKGGGTEAGYFSSLDMSTVIVGPGSMACIHVANEYVEIESLERCVVFLKDIAKSTCSS